MVKADNCAACHQIGSGGEGHGEKKPTGIPLAEWGRRIANRRDRMTQVELARQGLKELGCDDKLIDVLIEDRAKAMNANQVLQDILKLTDKNRAGTEKDEGTRLRAPLHPMAPEEQAKLLQFFKEFNRLDQPETANDEAGKN